MSTPLDIDAVVLINEALSGNRCSAEGRQRVGGCLSRYSYYGTVPEQITSIVVSLLKGHFFQDLSLIHIYPRDTRLVAAAQATRLFGDSLNDLLNNDAASAQARLLLENSAKIYEKRGIIAAVSNLCAGAKTEERLLQYGGERALTNYQHLSLIHI